MENGAIVHCLTQMFSADPPVDMFYQIPVEFLPAGISIAFVHFLKFLELHFRSGGGGGGGGEGGGGKGIGGGGSGTDSPVPVNWFMANILFSITRKLCVCFF
jgi:hypothetical protein